MVFYQIDGTKIMDGLMRCDFKKGNKKRGKDRKKHKKCILNN